jgi:D-alanine-D-alanine ligase
MGRYNVRSSGMFSKEEMKKKRIGVLMGGMSPERDVSLMSGRAILQALLERGYQAVPIEADEILSQRLCEGKVEVAFIGLHGSLGEDGSVQGLLEMMRIPYTGSGILASALAMNKAVSRQVFLQNGLPVPRSIFLAQQPEGGISRLKLPFSLPLVIKPCREGSSVGVSIVSNLQGIPTAAERAFGYEGGILVEEFIKGREVAVGILDDLALGAIEIVPKVEFYTYEAKYTDGLAEHLFPAPLPPSEYRKALDLGRQAHRLLGCEGATRVDLLYREPGEFFVLEVNSLPGMTPLSLLPEIARGAGILFPELVEKILMGARLRVPARSKRDSAGG